MYQEQLRGFFSNPQEIAAYLNQTDAVISEKTALIQVLEREQASLNKDLEKLYDLYFGDHVTKEGFTVKYTPLSERMKQLDDQIPTLQGELDFLTIQHLSQEEVISEAIDLCYLPDSAEIMAGKQREFSLAVSRRHWHTSHRPQSAEPVFGFARLAQKAVSVTHHADLGAVASILGVTLTETRSTKANASGLGVFYCNHACLE